MATSTKKKLPGRAPKRTATVTPPSALLMDSILEQARPISRAEIPAVCMQEFNWSPRVTEYHDGENGVPMTQQPVFIRYKSKLGFSPQTPGGPRVLGEFDIREIGAYHDAEEQGDMRGQPLGPDRRIVIITKYTPPVLTLAEGVSIGQHLTIDRVTQRLRLCDHSQQEPVAGVAVEDIEAGSRVVVHAYYKTVKLQR